MKKKLSLLLALLMLTSIAALAACSKVEPITVKVVINVAEEDDRGRPRSDRNHSGDRFCL